MKRLYLLFLVLALVLSLCACGEETGAKWPSGDAADNDGASEETDGGDENVSDNDDSQNTGNADGDASLDDGDSSGEALIPEEKNTVVGTWYAVLEGVYGEIVFNDDGSGVLAVQGTSIDFTWRIDGETVSMDNGSSVETMLYNAESDKLYHVEEGYDEKQEFFRKSDVAGALDSALVGTWGATIDGEYGELTFNADGSGLVSAEGFSQSYTWSCDNGAVIITQQSGRANRMEYRFDGDKLIFSYDGEEQVFTKKNGASQGSSGSLDASLVGTWGATIDGEYGELVFNADGSGLVRTDGFSQSYTWSCDNGAVIITQQGGGANRMDYRLEGDKLIFSYDGEEQIFTKK